MFFKKSLSSVVKQFTQARKDLETIINRNHDAMHKTHQDDKVTNEFSDKAIKAIDKTRTTALNKSKVKRAAHRAEINEADAWLDALPKIKK